LIWKAVQFNLAKDIEGKVQPKRVKIPKDLDVEVNIDLDKEAYALLSKDPTWLQRMQTKAKEKADAAVADLVAAVKTAEAKSEKFDAKTAEIFSKDLTAAFEKRMQIAGNEMVKEIDKLFDDYKKGKAGLLKFRIKSGCKIGASVIAIAASTAITAASHGALTPFAGVAIVRGGVVIAQECAKLATGCSQVAKLVEGELVILKKVMGENLKNDELMTKLRRNGAETALGVLSGLAGAETPSLKNCRIHIELHKTDISKLDQESKRLSEKIYEIMDVGQDWDKRCKEAVKKGLPAEKIAKVQKGLKSSEDSLDKFLKATIKVNESVDTAWANHKRFDETLTSLSGGVGAWTKYVDTAVNLAVDIGIAVGDASKVVESVANTFIAVANDVDQALAG
jgi:hypothetical protein